MTPAAFRDARRALGLTQRALGAALGVGEHAVYQYEHGIRRISQQTALAVEALLGRHEAIKKLTVA